MLSGTMLKGEVKDRVTDRDTTTIRRKMRSTSPRGKKGSARKKPEGLPQRLRELVEVVAATMRVPARNIVVALVEGEREERAVEVEVGRVLQMATIGTMVKMGRENRVEVAVDEEGGARVVGTVARPTPPLRRR